MEVRKRRVRYTSGAGVQLSRMGPGKREEGTIVGQVRLACYRGGQMEADEAKLNRAGKAEADS